MNANKTMKLPADCTRMTEEEMMTTNGGSAAETALKAVIALGGAVTGLELLPFHLIMLRCSDRHPQPREG